MTAFVLLLATPVVIGLVVILCLNRFYARDEEPERGYLGNDGSFGSGYSETAQRGEAGRRR
ncbi:hypothetical protein [Nocardioides sp.]|jgi:type IV secretory pathway protease TraF|uniref:hypothetical protein n=1 Tax=Nocardioides sp. TaxID=35761 RepID=UPI001D9A797C|nr:hypothetical protein [Nocardioides sp.]MBU1803042.1 hypothetical protein [Actinomycetota bacterium]